MAERTFSRRAFVTGASGAVLVAASGGAYARLAGSAAAAAGGLPSPGQSGIEHVVAVMMENRSFDHLLGWLRSADGKQSGLRFPDGHGGTSATHHLTDFMGCGHPDPDHSYEGGRAQYDGGAADGWLLDTANDSFALGYYLRSDLAFFGSAALDWTVCDRWFAPILGPTYPNRIYQHAGTTDRIVNTTTQSALPTIWDRLAAAGVEGRYYFGDVPFTAIWGDKYVSISRPYASFLADCAAGTLPAVAFVDPRFEDEDSGTSADDHPHADIRVGERFLNEVYQAVTAGPGWEKTVLVIDYDEWGGFFDHVPPPAGPDTRPLFRQRGFRIPNLIVSPFARRGHVAHETLDHTSVLRLICWRWGLAPLAPRDAAAVNLASLLDFSQPSLAAPTYLVPPVVATPCAPAAAASAADQEVELPDLLPVARAAGFPV